MLEREEYVEQAYFFQTLGERFSANSPTQEVLRSVREEVLATTKLPMAIDYMLSELKLTGALTPAMERLSHYFAPFQSYVMREAENERGRLDMRVALEILRREVQYRADGASPQGMFLYQFEALCRNRLGYDRGLEAVAADPIYDPTWRQWILAVRHQVGILDVADLIYVRSEYYRMVQARRGAAADQSSALFGEKEGRIALANRHKDPLFLFAALHRQLGYPAVPRPPRTRDAADLVPVLARRVERLEARVRLLEEEQRGGIDLAKFYHPPQGDAG
ncbi:MAG: hypothetical protein A2W31_09045 [Planctomycetes bacterium RBG_16_64_10]|nr:MAG: hypothetical protein A2W31_09045 [Planctomycetes bacterium RBG_16_64_10]